MNIYSKIRRWGAGVLACLMLTLYPATQAMAAAPSYVKAATYVSDAWVINFWNTESDHMDEEMEQIAADGFNSIVLVIPWREVQPAVQPVSYNGYIFQKLDKVMESANAHGLGVMFRVGYTWDYYGKESASIRYRELLYDPAIRRGWLDYVEKVYQAGQAHENFWGGFMTWEDFWNYVDDAGGFGTGRYSISEANKIGYQKYLRDHYTIEEINDAYEKENLFTDVEQVYIPLRSQYAYCLFYEFYDAFLNELLADSQKVFPDLSMEVRLDVDPVQGKQGGNLVGVSHNQTFSCQDSSFTSLMYSVSMGHLFGKSLTASEAISTMNEQLAVVRGYNGGKRLFVDQLLYMDITEGFENNARLYDAHRGAYLLALPDLLCEYTNGYAVWTYRNYTNNPIYNSQFALGSQGWDVSMGKVLEHSGSNQMYLSSKGKLSQKIGGRLSGKDTHENHVRFTAESDGTALIKVSLGNHTQQLTVFGKGQYDLNFGSVIYSEVTFTTNADVYLDNIEIYNFIQDGQLYDLDGNELSCLSSMRILNTAMNEVNP